MKTVPNKVWAEARLYSPSANEELIDALMVYHEKFEHDDKASLVMQTGEQATLLVFFYCAPVEKPDTFSCFYDISFLQHILLPGCSTVAGVVQAFANLHSPEPQM
jgi:hypothetical protein